MLSSHLTDGLWCTRQRKALDTAHQHHSQVAAAMDLAHAQPSRRGGPPSFAAADSARFHARQARADAILDAEAAALQRAGSMLRQHIARPQDALALSLGKLVTHDGSAQPPCQHNSVAFDSSGVATQQHAVNIAKRLARLEAREMEAERWLQESSIQRLSATRHAMASAAEAEERWLQAASAVFEGTYEENILGAAAFIFYTNLRHLMKSVRQASAGNASLCCAA